MNEKTQRIIDDMLHGTVGHDGRNPLRDLIDKHDEAEERLFNADLAEAERISARWLDEMKDKHPRMISIALTLAARANIVRGVEQMKLNDKDKEISKKSQLISTFFISLLPIVDLGQDKKADTPHLLIGQIAAQVAVALAHHSPLMQIIGAQLFAKVANDKLKEMSPEYLFGEMSKLLMGEVKVEIK